MYKKEDNRSYPNYNKPKEVFNNGDKKPLRYGEDALSKSLLEKTLKITLINGSVFNGVLSNLGMYDLTVKTKAKQVFDGNITRDVEKPIIILKSAIATVEVVL